MMHLYPPLAAISLVEWNTLADYARQHDSETGTTDLDCYDAHALDVIQVLTIRPDQSGPARVGAVRVIYAPDRADGIHGQSRTPAQVTHPLPPDIHAQLHVLHGRETVIVRVLDGLLSYDTPEDEAAAVRWLKAAAEGGHPLASNNLGARYLSGEGVPRDLVEAYRWFHAAAARGDRKAGKNRDAIAEQLPAEAIAKARGRAGI